jgi:hypothetical protein
VRPVEHRVRGAISRIVYSNPESQFWIFAVTPFGANGVGGAKRDVTVKGHGIGLAVGREVDCVGQWEESRNPKYPERQLAAHLVQEVVPTSVEGIRKLLHSDDNQLIHLRFDVT